MATMKIGTESQNYASADFSFPNNPTTVNVPFQNNYQIFPIPFSKTHVIIGAGGASTRSIVLVGEMFGASRLSNINDLMAQVHQNSIKRFWISGTRFWYVLGGSIKHDYQGGRTNFINYTGALNTALPYALDSTTNTYTWTTTSAAKTTLNDATGGSSGSFDNSGNAPTFVRWSINNSAGASITQIEIGDSSDYDTSDHKLTWTGTLTSGTTLNIDIFNYFSQGSRGTFKELRFAFPTNNSGGAQLGRIRVEGEAMPWIDAGASDQAFSVKLTGNSGTTVVTATWFDAYMG